MGSRENTHVQQVDLSGARVLLVEDEYCIADDLRRTLESAGAAVVGPFGTVAKAKAAIEEDAFDCAVIDLNLHGESALAVAERLAQEGKSFAIATGYGAAAIPEKFKGVPRIEKPFDPPALLDLVSQLSCARFVHPSA